MRATDTTPSLARPPVLTQRGHSGVRLETLSSACQTPAGLTVILEYNLGAHARRRLEWAWLPKNPISLGSEEGASNGDRRKAGARDGCIQRDRGSCGAETCRKRSASNLGRTVGRQIGKSRAGDQDAGRQSFSVRKRPG